MKINHSPSPAGGRGLRRELSRTVGVRVGSKYIPLTFILSPRGEEMRRYALLTLANSQISVLPNGNQFFLDKIWTLV